MKRRRRRSRSFRPLLAAAVLAGGLVLASAFAGVTIQENALARDIADLNAQIASESTRHASLEQSAAEKRTTQYVIDRAKQLGWVWPWEAVISVQREQARADVKQVGERPSRLARWIALFFGSR